MLPLAAACYTTLLTLGAAHLAGQPAPPRAGWLIFLLLALTDSTALALGGLQAAQICVGTINTLLGVLCAYWILKERRATLAEKLVGPLLIALGLIQFIYVVYQDDGAAAGASCASNATALPVWRSARSRAS